jgi:hypothetical protein
MRGINSVHEEQSEEIYLNLVNRMTARSTKLERTTRHDVLRNIAKLI